MAIELNEIADAKLLEVNAISFSSIAIDQLS